MIQKSTETINSQSRSHGRNLIAAATIGLLGAHIGGMLEQGDSVSESHFVEVVDGLEGAIDSLELGIDVLAESNKQLSDDVAVLSEVAGISGSQLRLHQSRESIPEPGVFPENIAELQDEATLHLLTYSGDDSTEISNHNCSVVKVSESAVSLAHHCVSEQITGEVGYPVKGGVVSSNAEYPNPELWLATREFFISNQTGLSYEEALESAIPVSGFSTNGYYRRGDGAFFSLDNTEVDGTSWFSEIAPLEVRSTPPSKGEVVRISGTTHINGNESDLQALGTVLGTFSATDFDNYSYDGDMTIVAIPLNDKTGYSCNFGMSGSGIVDSSGRTYGALAWLSRSASPEESIPANVPEPWQELTYENVINYKLLGTDYVLCGYSPLPDGETADLIQRDEYLDYISD